MSALDHTAARIIADGITQAQMHNAPADMVQRLQGALSFCRVQDDPEPTAPYTIGEIVPPVTEETTE